MTIDASPAAVVKVPGRGLSVPEVRTPASYVVPAAALVAVLARLPFLARPAGRDEAGYLLVGQQWHSGGSSLYGSYWVDRPPLLITVFRLAGDLGGLVPLRLIGCLAAALLVLASAQVARSIAGARAARWTAVTAAALSFSPLLGALSVNGELLAAPFVAGGLAGVVAAIHRPDQRGAAVAAALAGAAGAAALLVKQNMADVAVFAATALLLAWRRGEIGTPRLLRLVAASAAGAVVCLAVTAVWTMLHGTSLTGVFDAMYPFRIEAARVMAATHRPQADVRAWLLLLSWVASGGAAVMLVVAWALVSRRLRGTVTWALVATLCFDIVSVALGGSFWIHYLVELVVPVSVVAGLLVARHQPFARAALAVCVVTASIAWGLVVARPDSTVGSSVGGAVGRVAGHRDTIVTVWGHADVTRASGLSSPYPYLWSLPAHTLDPRQTLLDAVLAGPRAPTWFVDWSGPRAWDSGPTTRLLTRRYHPVAQLDGRTVFLLDGVRRATPRLTTAAAP